jgi:hypothetical protein
MAWHGMAWPTPSSSSRRNTITASPPR